MDSLGESAHLLGHSFGGLLALGVAGAATPPRPAPAPATDITSATARDLPPLGPAPTAPAADTAPALPDSSPPGLRRCVGPDGVAVFTDRRCELSDAVADGLPAGEPPAMNPSAPPPSQVVRVRTCARNQGDLLEGVRMALEARDANRFAEFYHWSDMDTAQGYRVMERLSRFAGNLLVDVQLVTSEERAAMASTTGSWDRPAGPPAPRRNFDLLRVDQLRGDDAVETQVTWFRLRNNAGCWWLQF